jgi:hypothetical protein
MEPQEQPAAAPVVEVAAPPPAAEPVVEKVAEGVVDVMGADLAEAYPDLKAMEEGAKGGLKFPVDRKWLDENMKNSQFKAFAHGLRNLATKERELTVSQTKALKAEQDALAADRAALHRDRVTFNGELAKLGAIVEKLPVAPAKPAGGEPDPKSTDARVQAYYAQAHVAKLFEPLREHFGKLNVEQAEEEKVSAHKALAASNDAFIAKTPDFATYLEPVKALLKSGEVKTVAAAYHVAKSQKLAEVPPPVVSNEPDFTKMTGSELTLYALEHPGWKVPAAVRAKLVG